MLHHEVFQINEGTVISLFTNLFTVQVPVLSDFCPGVISLRVQVVSLRPSVPTHS